MQEAYSVPTLGWHHHWEASLALPVGLASFKAAWLATVTVSCSAFQSQARSQASAAQCQTRLHEASSRMSHFVSILDCLSLPDGQPELNVLLDGII
ncbi:hypothetical protein BDW22DRAFT_1359032 [Trametopsis cervina]|nr:hypothetical protein BDW22DRAFT_1359032 [Trametopsis cervina]